jgi:hypothetical protein
VTAAAAAAVSGDVVRIGPGTFTYSADITFAAGVDVVGSGKGVTTLQSSGDVSLFFENANLSGLTVIHAGQNEGGRYSLEDGGRYQIADVDIHCTNISGADGLIIDGAGSGELHILGCRIVSLFDGLRMGISGTVFIYAGCYLAGDGGDDLENVGGSLFLDLPILANGALNGSATGKYINGSTGGIISITADEIDYDNSTSGLTATDVQAAIDELANNPGGRELLTAARTYYVNGSTGSDSNDGLSSGAAFATIQKAVNVASALDNGGFNITISVASGTYDETVVLRSFVGSGLIIIEGNTSTPSLVNVRGAGGSGNIIINAPNVLGTYRIQGFLLSGGTHGIFCQNSSIQFQLCEFGTVTVNHITVIDSGIVQAVGNYFVIGAAARHWLATALGVIRVQTRTITFVLGGATNFSAAFCASSQGRAQVEGCTFTVVSGSVTGTRYSATENGVIFTNGGGATYLPGNAAGTTATGGQYI